MSGLRERNRARRREAILDAAAARFRTHGVSEATVEQIASDAEVSPATVYNLVGSRERLLVALLDRAVARLAGALAPPAGERVRDAVGTARRIIELSTDALVADSALYRKVLGAMGDLGGMALLAFDPAELQIAAMRAAGAEGVLRPDVDPVAAGRQIFLTWLGGLHGWIGGALSDEGFRAAARHGVLTVLAAVAADEHRESFLDELRAVGAALVAAVDAPGASVHTDSEGK